MEVCVLLLFCQLLTAAVILPVVSVMNYNIVRRVKQSAICFASKLLGAPIAFLNTVAKKYHTERIIGLHLRSRANG